MSSYVTRPKVRVNTQETALHGYAPIHEKIAHSLEEVMSSCSDRVVLALECYPGTDHEELLAQLIEPLGPSLTLFADDYAQSVARVQERIKDCITEDRVFGVMSHYTIDQFFEEPRIEEARQKIAAAQGLVVVYGMGTTVLCEPDLVVYASLTRWEVQCRYRRGVANWKANNPGEDALRKFKRGYFFEWRVADRQKSALFDTIDFLIDVNVADDPRMVSGDAYRAALGQVASQPFRLVPYFDASVWGGHWMQERFGLDPDASNFGWAFDGVPEENSVLLDFGGVDVEIPAQDVVFSHPVELMGPKVHARFGTDYPIRFDYLDTMGGGNLSLQVHPLVAYIQDRFGMAYTQDESYYILDATADSCVYLGVKTGTDKDEMFASLRRAASGKEQFADERYMNKVPVAKHDHVHIPAGTVHAGGAGTVILEISATPYIFTFKLWDWGRVGLDGLPRPVHLDHGERNVLVERDTACAEGRLTDRVGAPHEDLSQEPGVRVEKTGLADEEFIETRRYWFRDAATLSTFESVNELNLVEGESVVVEGPDGSFSPLPVHYGETFIVPERVGTYRIRNTGDPSKEVAVIQAFVRNL